MNDQEAIRRIKRGDIGGLEALVARYQAEAARVAYLITREHQLADDVMQTAFITVWERIGQYDQARPFAPWFFRIVANAALKALRRSQREAGLEDEQVDLLADPLPGPEEALSAAEAQALVWEALGELGPEQRAVMVMRYYLGYTESEIAAATASPIGTVRWRLHAAHQKLRRLLAGAQNPYTEPAPDLGEKVERHE